jgi:serine/threonine protein kinase
MPNLIGQSLGRYHILVQLGEGGMAVVYKAFDTKLEREVALKVVRRQAFPEEKIDRILKRFEREAKALAQLNHPNIVPIMDSGQESDTPYLVMGYISGGTLKDKLKGKPVRWKEAIELIIPIAQALAYSHKQGIVHRDIKPSNILLTDENKPMLTDFGIARILQSDETLDLTGTGMGIGTPEYMAPEQGLGHKVDHRADIYALGIVLYEMLTGHKPFQADTPMAVVVKQIHDPLPRPSQYAEDMPSGVENILIKALAKDPKNRYKNMGEFSAVLVKTPVSRRNKKRKKIWKQAFAAMGISGLLGLGFYFSNHFNFSKPAPTITSTNTLVANSTSINNSVTETPDLANTPVFTSTPELPPANAKFGDVWMRSSDEMRMSFIPEGEFQMGSQNGGADEKPVHTVFLDAFWIDQSVVTNGMYCAPSKATGQIG